jgi:hypothetical protein
MTTTYSDGTTSQYVSPSNVRSCSLDGYEATNLLCSDNRLGTRLLSASIPTGGNDMRVTVMTPGFGISPSTQSPGVGISGFDSDAAPGTAFPSVSMSGFSIDIRPADEVPSVATPNNNVAAVVRAVEDALNAETGEAKSMCLNREPQITTRGVVRGVGWGLWV